MNGRKKCFGGWNQREKDLFHWRSVFSRKPNFAVEPYGDRLTPRGKAAKEKPVDDDSVAEGRILVASTTERDVKGGDRKDVGANTPESGVTGKAPGKRRSAPAKGEGNVANVLRSVYQRAVDEDIPAEMLDLLRKLD